MGRSVSYASGSIAKSYFDVSDFGACYDDEGNAIEGSYDEWQAQDDWDNWLYYITEQLKEKMPSLETCDEWLGNEDKAILENRFCYIGVSEYCGLACLWLVPKELDTYYSDEASLIPLQSHWLDNAVDKVEALSELYKLGTFSNGEAIYERKKG